LLSSERLRKEWGEEGRNKVGEQHSEIKRSIGMKQKELGCGLGKKTPRKKDSSKRSRK